MKQAFLPLAGLSLALAGVLGCGAAGAQTIDTVGPHNPYCGVSDSGRWIPNGNCAAETTSTNTNMAATHSGQSVAQGSAGMSRMRGVASAARVSQRVMGRIIAVDGHLVTIQQAKLQLVINDQPALDQQTTGRVTVGRAITAHGYWQDGTFFASRLSSAT
jgi:hypothetical protein